MTVPVLGVEEYQYKDNGVLLNSDALIPFVDLKRIQGLDNAPQRTQTHDQEGTDGGYVDSEYESIRSISLEGTIYCDVTAMETFLDDLKENFAPTRTNQPLYFGTDAGTRMVNAKSLGIKYDKDQLRRLGAADCQIQFLCEDPRIYSPALVSGSVELGTAVIAGRGYPKSYPFGYGGAATQNGLSIVLGGNRPSPGTIIIQGPITNPSVIYDTTGSVLAFGLVLDENDTITIDLRTKTVLLNGTANARGYLTISGGWFMLRKGTNDFRFLGTSNGPPAPTLTVSAYPSWR